MVAFFPLLWKINSYAFVLMGPIFLVHYYTYSALQQVQLCFSLFQFFELDSFAFCYEPILNVLVCIPFA